MEHGIDRMPFFSQDDGTLSLQQMRQEHLVTEKWRERRGIVDTLAFFAIVYAAGMVMTDPLTPPMELEPAIRLVAQQVRITDKPEMGLITYISKRIDQTGNATGKATGTGIGVVAFKRKDMKLHGGPFDLWRSSKACERAFHIDRRSLG